jgi:hypothetical protein
VVYDTVRDKADTADFMDNQPHIVFIRAGEVIFDTGSTANSGPVRFHGMATIPESSTSVVIGFAFTLGVNGAETIFVFVGQEGQNYKVIGTLKGAQAQLRFSYNQPGHFEIWTADGQYNHDPEKQCVWCPKYYKITSYSLQAGSLQQLRVLRSSRAYQPDTFYASPFVVVKSTHPTIGAASQDLVLKPPPQCITCTNIIVRGRLAQVLKISECNGASGMTCQIQFTDGAHLPSRIQVQQLDTNGRVIGSKFLPYPDLKPGEKGHATFPTGSAATIALVAEWKGHWRSSY